MKLFEVTLYWMLKRRRTPTLIQWWESLNNWKWPKEIPAPEDKDEPGRPRRNLAMNLILQELGLRTVRDSWKKGGSDAR